MFFQSNKTKPFLSLLIGILFCSQSLCGQTPFTDVTDSAGIKHQFQVMEGMFGGGACVFDYDQDGYEDLYITGGMNSDVFYRNNGDGTFENIFEGSGLELTQRFVTQGVVAADVNRDGWVDLFVTTITSKDSGRIIPRARNLLFLSKGNPTALKGQALFKDATEEYGLTPLYSFSTGGNFGDFNADGYPDLYVGNYFLEYEGELSTISDATIVGANQTAKGYLLENLEGKAFKNVYADYGLEHRGFGFGGLFTDFDNDGDQDLLVNHDFGYKATPSYLYENRSPWSSFRNVSEVMDMDLKINAMGAAAGDYNNDGFQDYYITNIKFNRFLINQGPNKPFVNKAKELGMAYVSISWGANWVDFDQDTDLDLYVSNGDLNPNVVPMADYYFENLGDRFQENARAMGLADYGIGRGSVVFDLENDGDIDILVVNQNPIMDYPVTSFTRLYRNDIPQKGNWIKIALKGISAESHGLGSRITVVADGVHMIREIDGGGSSHLSQNSTISHFGLGKAVKIDSIMVDWTGGDRQLILDQAVNQLLKIEQAESKKGGSWYWALVFFLIPVLFILYFRSRRRS